MAVEQRRRSFSFEEYADILFYYGDARGNAEEARRELKIDSNCESCARLFSLFVTEKHLFVTFKEHDEEMRFKYASEDLINLIGLLDEKLYAFLEQHGTEDQLEVNFKRKYSCIVQNYSFCQQHDVAKGII
ncbi:unnamed protein product [Acanthoscelides obtectus]|uniref:Uncharacterized protein n=1 Tax=Acanthoscelides obtectus TaxID=200917 RepID=A0A9P0KG46_ACAOB|nr:unnamed protein product [Acanthoscelides obtectus]CAK1620628.1 hypothetical protein AOBTE_LOCUS478 [Acanthoscelides obtectus]